MLDGVFGNAFAAILGRLFAGETSRKEARALLRLLTLELKHNVSLIDTLHGDGPQWSDGAAKVAGALQCDVLNMVFLPEARYQKLRANIARLKLPGDENESETTADTGDKLESLWVRIRTVKALGHQGQLQAGQREIRLLQRLTNLRNAMLLVVEVIRTSDID
jgi:hypothetical protein